MESTGRPVTYFGCFATEALRDAQRVLDSHVISSLDGRCRLCAVPGPCPAREAAAAVFSRSLRLPRRQPLASLIGRPTPVAWFRTP